MAHALLSPTLIEQYYYPCEHVLLRDSPHTAAKVAGSVVLAIAVAERADSRLKAPSTAGNSTARCPKKALLAGAAF